MNIGILGGTFNPVHLGHLYIAEEAMKNLKLDHVIFMPNFIPPHKENTSVSADERLKMLYLALSDHPDFSVSTFEIEKAGVSYTYETVEELHRRHPLDTFFFIIGEDSYVNFWKWKNPDRILKYVEVAVIERSGFSKDASRKTDELFRQNHKEAFRIQSETVDISSTDIRIRLKEGENVCELLPRKVAEYIEEKHLYQCHPWTFQQLQAYVKDHVKPSRYLHIEGVMEAALILSDLYGGNRDTIALAALCHDMLKDHEDSKLLELILRYGEVPADDGNSPQILHAQAGAIYLEHVCCIKNEELLNAVRYHTTGRAQMGLTEKIIFIADYIEKGRNFPGVEELRKLAQENLDKAVLTALSGTIKHLESLNKPVAAISRSAMEYYERVLKERTNHER